jgi:hypothetical protein
MAVPNVAGVLRGWTKQRQVYIVTKSVIAHRVVQTARVLTLDINVQPLQPEKLRRKPEEQRSWKWFSLLIRGASPELSMDSQVWIGNVAYRIESRQLWDESGFRRYEATQDYFGNDLTTLTYDPNGATSGSVPAGEMGFQNGVQVEVLGNTGALSLDKFSFEGWNTAPDGSGTAYAPGSIITIGGSTITLYAVWAETENST